MSKKNVTGIQCLAHAHGASAIFNLAACIIIFKDQHSEKSETYNRSLKTISKSNFLVMS